MINDDCRASDGLGAAMGAFGLAGDSARATGRFTAICRDVDGNEMWREDFDNLITTVGKNFLLDQALAGSAYTAAEFMGLISSASFGPSVTTTISSGTYTGGSGAVSLTTAGAHNLTPGAVFVIASAAGSGSFASLNGTWVATSGTTGTTLNFTIATGLTMTISGGNVSDAILPTDTMTSHAGWLESGGANAPTMSSTRQTCAWSAASAGVKALSTGLTFTFTGSGTVQGAFIVAGSGAVSTVGSTAGTLYSAGTLGTPQPVIATNTLTISYSSTLT